MARRKAQPKHYPSQTKPTVQTVTNPDRWDRSHGTYLTGRAAIDGADAIAIEMEQYWGVGRLRLLVPPELREKFDRQRYLFNAAIQNGKLEEVVNQSKRMVTAYMVCNQVAINNGAKRSDVQVMETRLDDGTVVAIVPNAQTVGLAKLQHDGRRMVIYTLEELGKVLSVPALVNKAKILWPGATVERVESKGDPLNAIDVPSGFDTEFDDAVPSLTGGTGGRPFTTS